jgi:hypothetical protein
MGITAIPNISESSINVSVGDPNNQLPIQIIIEMWKYFRLNNPMVRAWHPDVSHLKLNLNPSDILKYRTLYQTIIEPLFIRFIREGSDDEITDITQMIWVTSQPNETILVIERNREKFKIRGIDLSPQGKAGIIEDFINLSKSNNYFGPWVQGSIYSTRVI